MQPYAGSSAPLHQAVLGFTSPTKPFVTADPGYEAPERAAQFIGAKVIRIPLTKTYAHDVKKMAAASPDAGLIYICNPNNPTGTLTPKADIEWLVANKPKGSVLLLDEAYIHIAGAPMCSDLVAQDKDIVILRTFSKIYGMAGLRAGAAIGRPDLLEKIRPWTSGALPGHRHGGGERQPEIQRPGAGAPQDHRRRAQGRARLPGHARLRVHPFGVEQVHGQRAPSRAGRSSKP